MKRHESIRGYFAYYLYQAMKKDKSIYLVSIDLGYKMFDDLQKRYPKRVIVTGASEQAALGMAVGLAMSGKKVFVYTITPFFYRAFETIRNYIDHENIPVCLVGSGLYNDYKHDGYSHEANDIHQVMNLFKNIVQIYPAEKENIESYLQQILNDNKPTFLGLRR